ncbi:MAG: sugar phosphate isomerase/epimerase [Thermoguttaceae bacterium]|nr:sugar phosphate isomerase/epimerase [Thermoguttaceae bacterium]MDW8037237.1 sugar phosphate isomerase/epimerase family protein [Thermoguttaceae bacterium]
MLPFFPWVNASPSGWANASHSGKVGPIALGCLVLVMLAGAQSGSWGGLTEGAEPAAPYQFFVFDNGIRGIADPPKVLKELGYAGVAWGGWNVAPVVKQYQAHGLKVFSTYVSCHLDKTPAYDPAAKEAIAQLKGTDVILWLCVLGGKPGQEDEKALRVIREIADLAQAADLRVALYPHTGFYVATTADALRLVRQVDRKNVGVTINLCHELMTDQGPKLSQTIREAMPHLFLVSINGADAKEPGFGWDRLIQPLGRGNFDVYGFLKELHAAGYRGPIGLQCYGLKGDPIENLRQSMRAWREYMEKLATGK